MKRSEGFLSNIGVGSFTATLLAFVVLWFVLFMLYSCGGPEEIPAKIDKQKTQTSDLLTS